MLNVLENLYRDFPFSTLTDTNTTPTIVETQDAWTIEMDMPGVPKDKIAIKASGLYLDVRGERKCKGQSVLYHEKFRLPDTLRSGEGITATTDNGVLTVTIPKQTSGVLQIPVN